MLIAIKYPDRVKGLIGLAAAPNFIKSFEQVISEQQKNDLLTKGYFNFINNDFSYTITEKFIETALKSCLPEGENWPIFCPVHLIQGMKDASLSWRKSLQFAEQIASNKVEIKILKDSNHRLNDNLALNELRLSIANIVNI